MQDAELVLLLCSGAGGGGGRGAGRQFHAAHAHVEAAGALHIHEEGVGAGHETLLLVDLAAVVEGLRLLKARVQEILRPGARKGASGGDNCTGERRCCRGGRLPERGGASACGEGTTRASWTHIVAGQGLRLLCSTQASLLRVSHRCGSAPGSRFLGERVRMRVFSSWFLPHFVVHCICIHIKRRNFGASILEGHTARHHDAQRIVLVCRPSLRPTPFPCDPCSLSTGCTAPLDTSACTTRAQRSSSSGSTTPARPRCCTC